MKKILFFTCLLLFFILRVPIADAATFFLLPKSGEFNIGQEFNLEVRINSDGQGFNAAQATIEFPKDILEIKSLDYVDSVFNFWLEEPRFSNDQGRVAFIGGTTNGVIGASVLILKVSFIVKTAGDVEILLNDVAITSSDGTGTNILSGSEGASLLIKSAETPAPPEMPERLPPAEELPPSFVPEPTPVVREPVIVGKLPVKPEISVPLYLDPEKWNNIITDFLTQWELPLDVSGVSTALNREPEFTPISTSEGLFREKIFPALRDGVWYLHVRFRNNVGWGPAAHYRLAIDTIPPISFVIDSFEGLITNNPSPTLSFETSDGLSGLQHYLIRVDNSDVITQDTASLILPLQKPGEHVVFVRAMDNAGNIREDSIDLEILPIDSPVITFVGETFIGEGDLIVSGTAIPNTSILFFLKDKKDAVVFETQEEVDRNGVWEIEVSNPLKRGAYVIEIFSKDDRGALSLVVKSKLQVRDKPLLTLAGIKITQFWFFIGLIIVLIGGFAIGWFSYRIWRKQVSRKVIIAQRDVTNTFNIIKKDIEKILKGCSGKDELSEAEFILNKIKKDIEKMQKYVVENIKEISE